MFAKYYVICVLDVRDVDLHNERFPAIYVSGKKYWKISLVIVVMVITNGQFLSMILFIYVYYVSLVRFLDLGNR